MAAVPDELAEYLGDDSSSSSSSSSSASPKGSWMDELKKNRIFAAGAGMAGIGVGMAFLK